MSAAAIPDREAVPLDRIMQQVDDRLSRFDLDNLTVKPPPPSLEDELVAKAAARLFSSKEGRAVLEFLADKTVRALRMPMPLGVDAMQAYAHGQRREGQCDTFYLLLSLIAQGHEAPPAAERSE